MKQTKAVQPYTLLIGNGINNVNNNHSWQQILTAIVSHCKLDTRVINFENKSFPLLYEEILMLAAQSHVEDELKLKKKIAELVATMQRNELHERIAGMHRQHIITTNYDFMLEPEMGKKENKGIVDEKKYSVFRHFENDYRKVWHIHGDCHNPASINLGFEHYGGQLQQIRNYVVTGTHYKTETKIKHPLIKRINDSDFKVIHSWIDLFFTSDVYIVGLSLDFIEIDLWWLLTYIARQKFHRRKPFKQSITYFAPAELDASNKEKFELFKAIGIKIENRYSNRAGKDWKGYYSKVLDRIDELSKS